MFSGGLLLLQKQQRPALAVESSGPGAPLGVNSSLGCPSSNIGNAAASDLITSGRRSSQDITRPYSEGYMYLRPFFTVEV